MINQTLESIRAAGRKVLPMHEYLAEHDADTLGAYDGFLRATIYENDALSEEMRELVLAVACVGVGSPTPVVAAHARKAMAAGASREAMLQALELAAAVSATRTMAVAVNAMIEAEGEG